LGGTSGLLSGLAAARQRTGDVRAAAGCGRLSVNDCRNVGSRERRDVPWWMARPCAARWSSARLTIKARDALDSVRVGVIALWVWRATKQPAAK